MLSFRVQMAALGVILVAGFVMRCWQLDALGFWIDEDLTVLVTKSIRETGWPLLPSGEAYTRGALYSYLAAGFSSFFGSGEAALRFPSVLFSCVGVAVSFFYARSLAGPGAGLLAATILAFSPWDQHYARMARMYALLGAVILLATYLVHRGAFSQGRGSRIGACIAAAVAVPIHQIGAMTALLFWLPHAIRLRPHRFVWSATGSVLVVVSMLLFRQWQRAARSVGEDGLDIVVAAGSDSATLSLGFIPPITLNHSRFLLGDWFSSDPIAGWAALAGVLIATGLSIRGVSTFIGRNRTESGAAGGAKGHAKDRAAGPTAGHAAGQKAGKTGPAGHPEDHAQENEGSWVAGLLLSRPVEIAVVALLTALFLGCLAFNQLVLATVSGLLLWGRIGHPRFGITLVAAGIVTVLGFFLGQFLAEGAGGIAERGFLRLFFAIPVPFYRLFFVHHPILVGVCALGASYYFFRVLSRRDDGRFFLASLVFGLLLIIGLFRSPYVIDRYTFFLNGMSVVLFAVVVADAARWVGSRFTEAVGPRLTWVVLLSGLLLSGQFDPLEAYRATGITSGYGSPQLQDPDLLSHYRYDWRGTARFLQENMSTGDVLVAKDPVELWAYDVESDVRINSLHSVYAKTETGTIEDWYLRIPVFSTHDALQDYLREQSEKGRVVWIVHPAEIEGGPAVHLPKTMKAFLREQDSEVFRASDGVTRVLRLDPAGR